MAGKRKSKMHLSIPVAIKFTFTQDTKRAAIDRHLRLVHGVKNVNTAFRGAGAARQRLRWGRSNHQGLSLLIIGHSAERGEKPAASGPDGLCSYARPS